MNALIENFPRWFAIVSACALGVAVAHEYGYFWIIGPHFQTIATTYDYLGNALLWLPSTVFIVWVVYSFKHIILEPERNKWPRLDSLFLISNGVLIGASGVVSVFLGGPFILEVAWVLSIAAVYCGLAVYAFKLPHVSWETFHPLLFVPAILAFSFWYGSNLARLDLLKTDDIYALHRKSENSSGFVVMLRGFEKGLLVRVPDPNRTELVRWDDVVSLSRLDTPKESIACRLAGVMCKPKVKPKLYFQRAMNPFGRRVALRGFLWGALPRGTRSFRNADLPKVRRQARFA
jgi:hypothetical protein